MRAGLLRKRLRIEAPDIQIRSDGSQDVTFIPVIVKGEPLVVYGRIEPLRMDEFVIGGQDVSRTFVRLTIRWHPAIPPTYQLVDVYSDRVFEITGVLNLDERNREIRLLATEKLAPFN